MIYDIVSAEELAKLPEIVTAAEYKARYPDIDDGSTCPECEENDGIKDGVCNWCVCGCDWCEAGRPR